MGIINGAFQHSHAALSLVWHMATRIARSCRASLALTRKSSRNKERRNWVIQLPFLFSLL